MIAYRFLHLFLGILLLSNLTLARADAPARRRLVHDPNSELPGVHHTAALEPFARKVTLAFERALPELEKRMNWKLPGPLDVVVMDPSDSANGLAMNFPNTHIELFSSPFAPRFRARHLYNVDGRARDARAHAYRGQRYGPRLL